MLRVSILVFGPSRGESIFGAAIALRRSGISTPADSGRDATRRLSRADRARDPGPCSRRQQQPGDPEGLDLSLKIVRNYVPYIFPTLQVAGHRGFSSYRRRSSPIGIASNPACLKRSISIFF
jgi:hypothetical protein